ncbi:MAG TPA: hypothetical protein VFN90_03730 [Gemmatimonadales bacterium]|nr:hypothetical protein [Gemmatimonadales bacterium]
MRLLVAMMLYGITLPLAAQTQTLPTAVDSGRVVRLHTPTGKLVGRLTSPFRNTDPVVHFCRYPGPPCQSAYDSTGIRAVDTAALLRVEVSRGSRWQKGATIGGFAGGMLGGLFGLFLQGFCEFECPSRSEAIVVGMASGAVFWGAIGAIWGSGFPRWEDAP